MTKRFCVQFVPNIHVPIYFSLFHKFSLSAKKLKTENKKWFNLCMLVTLIGFFARDCYHERGYQPIEEQRAGEEEVADSFKFHYLRLLVHVSIYYSLILREFFVSRIFIVNNRLNLKRKFYHKICSGNLKFINHRDLGEAHLYNRYVMWHYLYGEKNK